MSEIVFVLAPGQNAFFVELADALRSELESLGVESSIAVGDFPELHEGRVYVLVPPHEYAELQGGRLPWRLLNRTIFICAEQPGTPWFDTNLRLTHLGGAIFDVNRASVRRLRRLGIAADHLPLGYTPAWDHFDAAANRDVDLVFMASMTERRERILSRWATDLWRHRSRLVISDNLRPNPETSRSFLSGDDKWALLARTKLLLNLHRTDAPYFEWQRVLDAIHCGAVVVTEPSTDFDPLVPGEHVISGRAETLHLIAEELLEDEERRRKMAVAAYELIRERQSLRAAAERLAAAAESLAGRSARGSRVRALTARGGHGRPEPSLGSVLAPLIERLQAPSAEVLRGVKDTRLAVIEVSRRVGRLERTIEDGSPPAPIVVDTQSSAHRAAAPRVSVITAVHNHEAHVGDALASVARGRYRDFELVVVDDGSRDSSPDKVRAWVESHDSVAALMLRHPVNRGLPTSRNSALGFARGEYVLVLDSDNQLYPHCLERLVEALDGDPGASAAYGILETFDDHGPRGLIGYLGWDPERLRNWNYVDALALFRRTALLEVGGYTTDMRLYGLEDYDLWCKLASRDMRATHVKEIVARYREAPGSMIALTNLSTEAAGAALAERHPGFFDHVPAPSAYPSSHAG